MKRIVWLLIYLVLFAVPSSSQDAICQELRDLHSKFGDNLIDFLNVAGRNCIEPAESRKIIPVGQPTWTANGSGGKQLAVDFEFEPGVYRLHLRTPAKGEAGYEDLSIWFEDIIEVPDKCLREGYIGNRINFPAQFQLMERCRVYGTLRAWDSSYENSAWEVWITEFDIDAGQPVSADGWSESGSGRKYSYVDLSFVPGIYRLHLLKPADQNISWIRLVDLISVPSGCF